MGATFQNYCVVHPNPNPVSLLLRLYPKEMLGKLYSFFFRESVQSTDQYPLLFSNWFLCVLVIWHTGWEQILELPTWIWNLVLKHATSLVAQMVKRLSTMWETWVQSLGWEDPLEKEMAIHSSTLAWKIPWMEEPGKATVHGVAKSNMTKQVHFFSTSSLGLYYTHVSQT